VEWKRMGWLKWAEAGVGARVSCSEQPRLVETTADARRVSQSAELSLIDRSIIDSDFQPSGRQSLFVRLSSSQSAGWMPWSSVMWTQFIHPFIHACILSGSVWFGKGFLSRPVGCVLVL